MPCENCNCGKALSQKILKDCDIEYQEWIEELELKGLTLKPILQPKGDM
jgi:hypothetical protein